MNDIRLLLVDDEEEFVEALAERLNLRNLAGHTAFSGSQALEFVEENEPHVMVLDLRMPGIDGMEVLRTVRRTYPLIQVIVHTAHGNDLDEAEAWQLGIYDYLRKPVEIDLLIDRIRGAYSRRNEILKSESRADR